MPSEIAVTADTAPSAGMRISGPAKLAIVVLFFLSGITGLVYEVTWTRLFTTIFGSTTYAVTAVLTAFMGGLALGGFVIGRIADKKRNPFLVYALLETGIGVSALLVPTLLRLLDHAYAAVFESIQSSLWLLVVARVVLSSLVILIPTFLMGGTLPVLCKLFVTRADQSGTQVALLYAVNTLGATAGCFLTGFFFLEMFGITTTIRLTSAVNFLLALLFFLAAMVWKPVAEPGDRPAPAADFPDAPVHKSYLTLILIGFACAGFVSLSYEVLWTRLLVFKLKTTVYAFSIMLTTFLVGIGLGSLLFLIAEKFRLIKNQLKTFGVIQSLIGLMGLSTILLFGKIDSISVFESVATFNPEIPWKTQVLYKLGLSGMIMLGPTLLMGLAFPLVSRFYTRNINTIGRSVGNIYAVNTIGCILGSLLTGFVLVRVLGTQSSIVLISLVALTVGTLVLAYRPRGVPAPLVPRNFVFVFAPLAWLVALGLIAVTPGDTLLAYYNIYENQMYEDTELLYAHEGVECITTVHRYPDGERGISTSSINVAGTHFTNRTTQKLQAHIPMLVHPQPTEVLQVGFGSGETCHILTMYDTERVDLVEISPGVIETSAKYFGDINGGVVDHPKFRPIIMDGANYMSLTKRKYDVIMNDASWPFYVGCSTLYTKDYFERGRKRLKAGGIMTTWMPIEMLGSFKTVLRSFHEVFPHVSVWLAVTHTNKHALLLGSEEELQIDVKLFLDRFDRFARADLKSVHLDDPVFFLDAFQMDETVLGEWLDSVPLHTIDKPVLEFAARQPTAEDKLDSWQLIATHNVTVASHLIGGAGLEIDGESILTRLESARAATQLVMAGFKTLVGVEGSISYAPEFGQALAVEPYHPGANYFTKKTIKAFTTLGSMWEQRRQYDKARAAFEIAEKEVNRLTSLRPDSAEGFHLQGLLYEAGSVRLSPTREAGIARAIEEFSRAIVLDPMFSDAYVDRATVYASNRQFELAIDDLDKAIEVDPDHATAYFLRGTLSRLLGRPDDAERDLRQAERLDPKVAEPKPIKVW